MGFFDFFKGLFAKKHVRLGLALGSGGAKGAALIGAMKAFEEENIKFDLVAGTSIGSIVGGMVALGYTSDDIMNVIKQYGADDPKQLVFMKLKGESLDSLLDVVLGEKTFDDTVIPFCAVAADLNTGEEVDMKNGKLSTAMAASSAIPPVFRPVGRNNRKLVDGAFVNAVPADVVKKMGADVVVSINLTSVAMNSVGKATLDVMYKGHGIAEQNRLHQLKDYSDLIIDPDLAAFSTGDVTALNQMYSIGYAAAKDKMPEIKALLKKHGVKF
ncbi:MAG: patatin-like phospholipase family protein [Clostridia bacterium]|nr:patatin-like phospholipase family protein [Clostridia bacterium]